MTTEELWYASYQKVGTKRTMRLEPPRCTRWSRLPMEEQWSLTIDLAISCAKGLAGYRNTVIVRTGEQMLKVAGLDFFIQRRFLGMTTSQPNQLVTEPLKEFRAIVRSDNDHVFQVASDRYQPVQNQEIVEFFREYCSGSCAISWNFALAIGRSIF